MDFVELPLNTNKYDHALFSWSILDSLETKVFSSVIKIHKNSIMQQRNKTINNGSG